MRSLTLLLLLISSNAMASGACVCKGGATLVGTSEVAVKVSISEGVACKGNGCCISEKSDYSVFFAKENSVAPYHSYMSKSGAYLKNMPKSYEFGFVYSCRTSEDGGFSQWLIEPQK